jgi:hypothetical protein
MYEMYKSPIESKMCKQSALISSSVISMHLVVPFDGHVFFYLFIAAAIFLVWKKHNKFFALKVVERRKEKKKK